MPDKSFNNAITTRNVSLAIEQLLIAPATQVWTPGRVTLSNTALPTGFRHLGSVVEDSVALTVTREMYQLEVGIPRVLAYTAVTRVIGRLEVTFNSFSQRQMAYAMGNVDPVNSVATIYTTYDATVANYTQIEANTPGFGGLAIGDVLIASATSPGLTTTDNEAEINSIGTGADSLQIYFTSPGFPTQPSTGWFFAKLTQVAVPAGTSKIKDFHILGVADTVDGYQIVHDMQKARVG